MALGLSTVAGADSATADVEVYATALGANASAAGTYAAALASGAKAYTNDSLALGHSATVGVSGTADSGGVSGIAIGSAANTSKDYAISMGANATASGANAVAIGGAKKTTDSSDASKVTSTGAIAEGDSSIAIGDNAEALKNFSVAIGYKADAKTNEYTMALGVSSVATGSYASALASDAKAYTNYSLAIGYQATVGAEGTEDAGGVSGIAIGQAANTSKDYGISMGANSSASGENSIAIGGNATSGACAYGVGAIALGNQAQATVENAIAIGVGAQASANAVAIGQGSVASVADTVSVGASTTSTRKIVNVTAGSSTKDAAIWDQLVKNQVYEFDATTGIATVLTNDGTTEAFKLKLAAATGGSIASLNTGYVTGGAIYTYLSPATLAEGSYNYIASGGDGGKTTAENLVALDTKIGAASGVEHSDGTTLYESTASVESQIQSVGNKTIKSVTITGGNDGTDTQKMTFETYDGTTTDVEITAKGTVASGDVRLVDGGTVYTAIQGVQTSVTENVAAITGKMNITEKGDYVKAGDEVGNNLKALDSAIGTVNTKDGKTLNVIEESLQEDGTLKTTVSQNLEKLDAKIGTIKSDTYNAINENATISDNLVALDAAVGGAGADLKHIRDVTKEKNAKVSETGIALGDQRESAGASGDYSIAFGMKAEASQDNAIALGRGAKASANNAVAIGSDSEATEENTVSVGKVGSERKITNVAAGVNDTDAVNVSQLNAVIKNDISGMRTELTKEINQVAAGSAALAALRPESFNPDDKWSFAFGYGHYKNTNAGALGVFYKPNEDTTVSFAGTLGYDDSLMNAGVSFKLGIRSKKIAPRTSAEFFQELSALHQINDKLLADNQMLKEDNAAQAKRIENLEADNEKMKEQIEMILAEMAMWEAEVEVEADDESAELETVEEEMVE